MNVVTMAPPQADIDRTIQAFDAVIGEIPPPKA